MRLLALMALVAALLLVAGVPAQDDARKELDKLQGTWMILADEREGNPVATDRDAVVRMRDDQFTTQSGSKVLRRGTLKLDPSKSPKEIDVTYTEGEFEGKTLKGIYTLEGDNWKICYGLPGEERPREIPRKTGKGQMLLTLQRGKP